jgi:hypothetical protein
MATWAVPPAFLVEHNVASRRQGVVEADPELGDHVRARAGALDQLAEQVGGAPSLDRGDAAAFEAERDRLVDEPLDRVRDGQVGDEDAVGAVGVRCHETSPPG